MYPTSTTTYDVPQQYIGKNLKEISDAEMASGREGFRSDTLAGILGIGEYEPLKSGQYFTLGQMDPGFQNSGEYKALSRIFPGGASPEERAIQPAVGSLEQGLTETSAKYAQQRQQLEAEKLPLQQRYKAILDELTRKQGVEQNQTTLATAREMGKRGVSTGSGLYDQEILNRLLPINQYYGGQFTTANLARESDLRALSNNIANSYTDETSALREIRNAIAQMKAGAAKDSLSNALAMYQFNKQLEESAKDREASTNLAKLQAELKSSSSGESASEKALKEAQAQYYLAQAGKLNRTGTSGAATGAISLDDIFG